MNTKRKIKRRKRKREKKEGKERKERVKREKREREKEEILPLWFFNEKMPRKRRPIKTSKVWENIRKKERKKEKSFEKRNQTGERWERLPGVDPHQQSHTLCKNNQYQEQ